MDLIDTAWWVFLALVQSPIMMVVVALVSVGCLCGLVGLLAGWVADEDEEVTVMECRVCGRGPREMVTLFRANPVGRLPAVWECSIHHYHPPSEDVAAVVTAIEQDNRTRFRSEG